MWWIPNRKQIARENLACVASLASALLVVTRDRPMRQYFRKERVECRRIMRRSVRPCYIESGASKQDLNWLRDVLGEVNEFSLEIAQQPEQFASGWGNEYPWLDAGAMEGVAR